MFFCLFCTKSYLEIINFDEQKSLMFPKNYAKIDNIWKKAQMVQALELLQVQEL